MAAFGRFIRSSFVAVDALTKVSDKLGIATEDLAGLQFAAEQTGVTIKNMELGLQRMTRRVAEAGQGTGEAKAAIKELGLVAEDLAKLSPDKQFLAIADAMEQVTNQADRVRLGFKLFDAEGVALINTMRGGSQELQKFITRAQALGVAIDRNAADRIVNANDAIGEMQTAFRGLANTIATAVAPAIENLAGNIILLAPAMKKVFEAIGPTIGAVKNVVLANVKEAQSAFALFAASIAPTERERERLQGIGEALAEQAGGIRARNIGPPKRAPSPSPPPPEIPELAPATTTTGTFRQLGPGMFPSTVGPSRGGGVVAVTDPALQTTNQLLAEQNRTLLGMTQVQ